MKILLVIILFLTGEDYYFISQKKGREAFLSNGTCYGIFFMNRNLFCENVRSKFQLTSDNVQFSVLELPKCTVCSSKFCIRIASNFFWDFNHCHKVPEYLIMEESGFLRENKWLKKETIEQFVPHESYMRISQPEQLNGLSK